MSTVRTNGDMVYFWCPGCDIAHGIDKQKWTWNGDEDRPTFYPSVLVRGGADDVYCHSFVTVGEIEFLADSRHALAGKKRMLPPWPLRDE